MFSARGGGPVWNFKFPYLIFRLYVCVTDLGGAAFPNYVANPLQVAGKWQA